MPMSNLFCQPTSFPSLIPSTSLPPTSSTTSTPETNVRMVLKIVVKRFHTMHDLHYLLNENALQIPSTSPSTNVRQKFVPFLLSECLLTLFVLQFQGPVVSPVFCSIRNWDKCKCQRKSQNTVHYRGSLYCFPPYCRNHPEGLCQGLNTPLQMLRTSPWFQYQRRTFYFVHVIATMSVLSKAELA